MLRVASLVALLLPAPPSFAQEFDFKGISLGSKPSISTLEDKLSVKCATSTREQTCSGTSTMMELPAQVFVDLYDGVVARIDVSFEPVIYSVAEKFLSQKFGEPRGRKARMTVWRNERGDLAILDAAGWLSLSSFEDQQRNETAVREMGKDL